MLSFSPESTILVPSLCYWAEPCAHFSPCTWVCLWRVLQAHGRRKAPPPFLLFGTAVHFICSVTVALIHEHAVLFSCGLWFPLTFQLRNRLWPSTTQGTLPLSTDPHPPCPKLFDAESCRERSPSMFASSLAPNPTARNFAYSPAYRQANSGTDSEKEKGAAPCSHMFSCSLAC